MSMLPKQVQCAEYLGRCDELSRQIFYSSLSHERLRRKYNEIFQLFENEGKYNWNEVFFILFLRRLGDGSNSDVFVELARRLPLHILMRERLAPIKIEAMLIATAGFIDSYTNEEYLQPLRDEAKYLLHKYNIIPIPIRCWDLGHVRPNNHPIIRLSQVAQIICTNEFIFENMMLCKGMDDVDNLFRVQATEHLHRTHPHLTNRGLKSISIGADKRVLLGINLVVPLQFAYGYYLQDDDICNRAHELNERLPAESNRYIRDWRKYGINPKFAFETQALIQLTTCYCAESRCEECVVGSHIATDR